ncbi:Transcription factor [Quillaja saponaria]|nr:Transcription factor [Quillaja saponaria]
MHPTSFNTLEYSFDYHQNQQQSGIMDYMPNNPLQPQIAASSSGFYGSSSSFDKLSFADMMQFADFGVPKLALNQTKNNCQEESGMDPIYFLKFPVVNNTLEDDNHQTLMVNPQPDGGAAGEARENEEIISFKVGNMEENLKVVGEEERGARIKNEEAQILHNNLHILGEAHDLQKNLIKEQKNKRKRSRAIKTSEEVESQRMTHIAVERSRRKQMNEHLRVLRLLMPGSYVQRGDQASIIGGAIDFVRELEQLLECLESRKRRRLIGDSSDLGIQVQNQPQQHIPPQPPFFPHLPNVSNDQMKLVMDYDDAREVETAENKSCLADVEVKVLGFDAMIKILCRRRPGQLIKTIAALEDLQLNILHTNITTIEQTVLYSFNVKVVGDSRFTAEDIASSVQQIFSFIHANM